MTPVTQTKVVIKNNKGETVTHGNCYAAAIASIIGLPITEVPNVEVFFHLPPDSCYWLEVMLTFLESKGYELCSDDRFRVFHDGQFGLDKGLRAQWLTEILDEETVLIEFPIGDDDPNEHSQSAPYSVYAVTKLP